MATLVGTQKEFADALSALIELDYDAVSAYETAIDKVKHQDIRGKLEDFKNDHRRHIDELGDVLSAHGHLPPTGPDMKSLLASGKAAIAQLFGDKALLGAMITNENDTNTAYQRMNERNDCWPDAVPALKKGWDDEIRHRNWMKERQALCDAEA